MRKFPENEYEDDVRGKGTSVELTLEMKKRGSRFVEIRTLADEKNGYRAGTFGEFQHLSNGRISMSVRFMGDGKGGGLETDALSRSVLDIDLPIEWVIHREVA